MFNEKIIPPLSHLKKDASDNYWYSPVGASYSPDEIFNHALQLEAELAGMELMDAEGESFGETIVRENEQLKAEIAAWETKAALFVDQGEELQQAQAELKECREMRGASTLVPTKSLKELKAERDALARENAKLKSELSKARKWMFWSRFA